ncbi:MAG: metallophosphoesterase [Nanoarchaeota archaeon]
MKYKFIDKSVFFPQEKILVVADLHLGYEQALNEAGVFLPKHQFKEIMENMKKIIEKTGKLKEIIILGDLKHEFGTISSQEWREVLEFLDFLQEKTEKIVLIKGNHDTILEPIAKRKNLEVKDFYIKKDVAFLHGHKSFLEVLDKKVKLLVMGHKHPAITIRENVKAETYKCFLVGKFKDKEIIILPSFFPLVEGSDVFIEDTNLAFKFKFSGFKVYVVGDKVYGFGKLKKVGKLI